MPNQQPPAYETLDHVDPEVKERVIAVRYACGMPTFGDLQQTLIRHGYRQPEVVELGLLLPEDEYEALKRQNAALPERTLPAIRRRR